MKNLKQQIIKNITNNQIYKQHNIQNHQILEINGLFFLNEKNNTLNDGGKYIAKTKKEIENFIGKKNEYKKEIEKHNIHKIKRNKLINQEVELTGIREGNYFHIKINDNIIKKTKQHNTCYEGEINSLLTYYILNELTIQGNAYLPEHLRGKGYANEMRDFAEELMGLKAVPHELNHTIGKISDSARKSWEKRALQKNVPGMNNDININNKVNEVNEIKNFLNIENINLLLIENIKDYKIKTIKTNETINNIITETRTKIWLEDINGICYDPMPFINENELLKYYNYDKEQIIELDTKKIQIKCPINKEIETLNLFFKLNDSDYRITSLRKYKQDNNINYDNSLYKKVFNENKINDYNLKI